MEQVGDMLNKVRHETALATTSGPPPQWGGLLLTIAQTRGKELMPGELRLWEVKLRSFPPELIEWGMLHYAGEFFPTPDAIIAMIERKRESLQLEKADQDWGRWKAEIKQAEAEGKIASAEFKSQIAQEVEERLAKKGVYLSKKLYDQSQPNVGAKDERREDSQTVTAGGV